MKKRLNIFMIFLLSFLLIGCGASQATAGQAADNESPVESSFETADTELDESGSYTSKDDVACYIYLYGHLPSNFITKKEAEKLGWPGGSLEPYAPGMCIGGSYFGNYEGLLPEKEGRTLYGM